MSNFPLLPQFILIFAALLIPLFKGKLRAALALVAPLAAFASLLQLQEGMFWKINMIQFELVLARVDGLSLIFANIFILASFIAILFNLKAKGSVEHFAGLLYAGCAVGMVFAGDIITFFIFWEMLTIGAVLLILSRKSITSMGAAVRYMLVHVVGGLILMAGVMLHIAETGSIAFGEIGVTNLSSLLIFIGFGVNCAWPFLHSWLPDAYPEASIGGTLFLATFTTKGAIYALIRAFPGEPSLIWIGTAMAIFALFYAVIENDLRKVLAYSLINQVGFMVIGVGVGTPLALNGAAAQAYCHIIYKSLLFMAIGAVMYRTGKSKATELGGLFKSMPWTAVLCIVASMASFPLFNGFVSKSMIMSAAAYDHQTIAWLAMVFGTAGVFLLAGIKITYFAFFSKDSGIRTQEAPWNMLVAMGIAALLVIGIGVFPNQTLYQMLPFAMEKAYEPYTLSHIIAQLLLLGFTGLAFSLMLLAGVYPAEIRSINLDFDVIYRKTAGLGYRFFDYSLNEINRVTKSSTIGFIDKLSDFATQACANVAVIVSRPFWAISGKSSDKIEELSNSIRKKLGRGTLPFGFAGSMILAAMIIMVAAAFV
jgi:multicomponent Na+:H+ antiporter subunit D